MLNSKNIFTGLVLVTMAGCTAEQCGDPNKDGLGKALGCTTLGGYQQQTDALSAELQQKRSLADELRAENNRLRGQLDTLNGEARQAANRLIGVNSQIAALDDQLNTQLGRQQMAQSQYDLLKSQLNDLNRRRANLNPANAADAAQIAQLESEIADLRALF